MRVVLIISLVFLLTCTTGLPAVAADPTATETTWVGKTPEFTRAGLTRFSADSLAVGLPSAGSLSSADSTSEEQQTRWKAAVLSQSGFSGIKVYLNNDTPVTFDVQPRVVDGRVLVPVRQVSEALGAEVSFTGIKITVRKGSNTAELTVESKEAYVNGNTVRLDVPVMLVDGRTLVPLRFIGESLNKAVYFAAEGEASVINLVDLPAPAVAQPAAVTPLPPAPVVSKESPPGKVPASFSVGGPFADLGKDIAVDGNGNMYVIGYFYGTTDLDPGLDDYKLNGPHFENSFVAKYDSRGNLIWAKGFGNPSDMPNSVALDGEGNIYITGFFRGRADFDPGPEVKNLQSTSQKDCYLAKYSSEGNYLWAIGFGSELGGESMNLAVDTGGNAYVTGYFKGSMDIDPGEGTATIQGSSFSADIFVASYDKNGRYRWGFSGGGAGQDQGQAVAVDGSGNCYVAGYFEQTTNFGSLSSTGGRDAFLAKYRSDNGELIWAKSFGGIGNDQVGPGGIALDGKSNIYLTGDFSSVVEFDLGPEKASISSRGQRDIFVVKYDPKGNYLWAIGLGDNASDGGQGIAVDKSGQVYVCGWFRGTVDFNPGLGEKLLTARGTPAGASDFFLVKYSWDGKYLWALSFGGRATSAEDSTLGTGLAADPSGGVVATGGFFETVDFDPGQEEYIRGSNGSSDVFVVKYDENGNLK